MNEQVLSMAEPKQKLAKLEEFIPNAPGGLIYEFGRFLVGHLNPELVPMGFVMACELALYDLQKGVNGYTNKPIQSKLVGYPPVIYALLRMEIPRIADAIFPADFAASVKTITDEIDKEVSAGPTTE